MFTKIRVIHIAVNSVKEAAKDYSERFGLKVSSSGELPELGIRNAMLPIGEAVIELIEPIDRPQGPLPRFLQSRGEGVYMTGWEVDNLEQTIQSLQKKGVSLINADPAARAKGANVFIHPKSAHGVMIELLEKPKK
jgi:methylmalonyl-CoA epimerase